MRPRRSVVYLTLVALVGAAACGDSGGTAGPSAMAAEAGSGQSGHIGSILPQPLVVRLTGAGGDPFPGVTVTWAVTSGSATLGATSSQSDDAGRASTTVTLGSTPGAVLVTASSGSLTPVTFALTAVGPAALAAVSGGGQTGPVGGELLEPLRVELTGTDGQPYAGATVAWAFAAGAGIATPAASLTDGNGEATTVVSPAAAGNLTVTATVGTLTPATFTATAVPPCAYLRPYVLGDVVNAQLTTLDCGLDLGGAIFYYDFYQLDFASQQSFTVGMASGTFDTWVDLFRLTGELLGTNDDSLGVPTNSYFEGIFAAGNYIIGASSYDPVATGAYTLRTAARPSTISQCRVVWGTRGITVSETIAVADCVDNSTGSAFYSDRMAIALESGATLEVRMASAAVDPFVYLVDIAAAAIVASNDDSSAGNPTAFLTYTAPQGGYYFLDFGTAVAGETGAYTITLGGSGVAGTAPAGGGATRVRGAPPARPAGGKAPTSFSTPLRDRLRPGDGGASP